MKNTSSWRLQLHGAAVWVDRMTTVVKLFQVQCHALAVVPAAAAIPYVTCVRDSPDQTLVGLLLHPGLLLPFKNGDKRRNGKTCHGRAVALSIIRELFSCAQKWATKAILQLKSMSPTLFCSQTLKQLDHGF